MYFHENMIHIEEVPSTVMNKQSLSKDDIQAIVAFEGTEEEACKTLSITREQYRYVKKNYDHVGRHTFRSHMNTLYYE